MQMYLSLTLRLTFYLRPSGKFSIAKARIYRGRVLHNKLISICLYSTNKLYSTATYTISHTNYKAIHYQVNPTELTVHETLKTPLQSVQATHKTLYSPESSSPIEFPLRHYSHYSKQLYLPSSHSPSSRAYPQADEPSTIVSII